MSCIDQCTIGQICLHKQPPVCAPLVNQTCLAACLQVAGNEYTGNPFGGGNFGGGENDNGNGNGNGEGTYCDGTCQWESPGCRVNNHRNGTGGPDFPPGSTCVASECSSGCCCCDSLAIAESIRPRCYDRVVVSCNQDGTGPGGNGGGAFPLTCDSCFEACDLIINDPNGCSKLSTLSWWTYGNTQCSCECKALSTVGGCLLHCALCGKCNADITVQNSPCDYRVIVEPSDECCRHGKENVRLWIYNVGSERMKLAERNLFNLKYQELLDVCAQRNIELALTPLSSPTGIEDGLQFPTSCADCCPDAVYASPEEAATLIQSELDTSKPSQRNEILILVHGWARGGIDDCTGFSYNHSDFISCLERHNVKISLVEFSRDLADPAFSHLLTIMNPPDSTQCSPGAPSFYDCQIARFDIYNRSIGSWQGGPTAAQYDELWRLITAIPGQPITTCDCIDSTPKILTFDKRNCEPRSFEVCGTTIVVDTEDISMVCCDSINCECINPCNDDRPECPTPPPDGCLCGISCTPVCQNGIRLFPNLEAAVEAVWGECRANAISIDDNDCIQIMVNGTIKTICRAEVELSVTNAWITCEEGCTGPDCNTCTGPDCENDCVGPDCEDCTGPNCNDCTGPDCEECVGKKCVDCEGPDCEDCIGPECDGCIGEGCDSNPGGPDCTEPSCNHTGGGSNPPPNIDCTTNEVITPSNPCFTVKHPDVVILNNGIGLVAFEDTSDTSVVKIKQLKTSIGNKFQPNRSLRYGRLQNPIRWIVLSNGNYRAKLYYHEPIGDVHADDGIFFLNGPLSKQAFIVTSVSSDSIGEYIEFTIPRQFEFYGNYGSQTDDRYDVQWVTYDTNDDGLMGDRPVPTGVDANLDATREDINNALSLSPHYYNGEKVPVAYPKIAVSDNYDNEDENSQFVYVTYQALENNIWRVYLRQLRLSEFKKSADVLLSSDNINVVNSGNIVWTCRSTCIKHDCTLEEKSSTITSVWTAKTEDGDDIYNCDLRSGSLTICSQIYSKKILTLILNQTTTSLVKCPEDDNLQNWKSGSSITTAVPVFVSDTDQDEINSWANTYFNAGVNSGGDVTVNDINCKISYPPSESGGWCSFDDATLSTINKYKGIYVSDPVLVSNPEINSTHPKCKVDYYNRLFIVYNEHSLNEQNIIIKGTDAPETSLPTGIDSRRVSELLSFDDNLKFFYTVDDFTHTKEITNSGLNQHPDMWIDLNNVIHVVWQRVTDGYWEIFYANSDTYFEIEQITKSNGRSLKPSICGDNYGNLTIVWHDDRFGQYEIMGATNINSRIKPLFQQNEYLASIYNSYQHTVNYVPFTVTNDTENTICYKDIVVRFYQDRNLTVGPLFAVRKSVHPYAFTQITGSITFPVVPEAICLNPGESVEYQLTLTPEVLTSSGLVDNEFTIGLAQNKTYFTAVFTELTDNTNLAMPNQYRSMSCTECTGIRANYDFSSCSINFPVINSTNEVRHYSVRLLFFADQGLTDFISSIDSTDNTIENFYINDISAENVWGNNGLLIAPGETVNITCFPPISGENKLVCGVTYFVTAEVSSVTDSNDKTVNWGKLGSVIYRWVCDCNSERIESDKILNVNSLVRWRSSAKGLSDTRITTSSGNSLNPVVRFRNGFECVVFYQDDRREKGKYEIISSVFSKSLQDPEFANNREITASPTFYGQNIAVEIDKYDRVFMAVDSNNITTSSLNQESYITVKRCGYDLFTEVVSQPTSSENQFIFLQYLVDNRIFSSIVKQIRVKNDYVRYHITRNGSALPVVFKCSVVFDIIGTPECVAVRLKNENQTSWSEWKRFEPQVGNYHMELQWVLSDASGMKNVSFQFATYAGLTAIKTVSIVADYDDIQYSVESFYDQSMTKPVSNYNFIPVITSENSEINIYFKMKVERNYIEQHKNDENHGAPIYSVITQGEDLSDQITTWQRDSQGNEYFIGHFTLSSIVDGVAMIVPAFRSRCSSQSSILHTTAFNKYNIFNISSSVHVEEPDLDKYGRHKYIVTDRNLEDPYLVFGDPNYRIEND